MLLTALLVACDEAPADSQAPAGEDTQVETTDTEAPTGDDTSTDTAPTGDTVTWYADASPVLQQHCIRCHYEAGLGTGDFTDYATAAAMAEILVSQIDAGEMPPPASDPACRDYQGSDAMHISTEARDVLQAWGEAGTPEGDPATAVVIDALSEEMPDADTQVLMPAAYTPTFEDPREEGNEYRCFVLDPLADEDVFVTALNPVIDERSIVHHIVLYTAAESRLQERHTAEEGFDCIHGEEFTVIQDIVAAWAPGMLPIELPEGVGIRMKGGQKLLMQMHYFDPGNLEDGVTDQTGYAFKTTDEVEIEADLEAWGIYDFRIPADDPAYSATDTERVALNKDLTIYTMFPHMHVLGSGFRMTSTDADGNEHCLVDSDGYDFNNQLQYVYSEPFVATGGSELEYTCTWNNSASNPDRIVDPPVETTYGERTDQEMCFFFGVVSSATAEVEPDDEPVEEP